MLIEFVNFFWKLSLCLFLVIASNAQAQYVGTSGFAIFNRKFPCDDFLEIQRASKKPFAPTLWGTFGTDATCLRRFTEVFKDRPHAVQIHLLNNTCIRNHACFEGEPFRGWSVSKLNHRLEANDAATIQTLVDRVKRIEVLASGFRGPNTELILGLGLEDNYTTKAYQNLLAAVKPYWPYLLSRNPLKRSNGFLGDADLLESHGSGARCGGRAQIVNQDGTYFTETQSRRWLDRSYLCGYIATWVAEAQGRKVNRRQIEHKVTRPRSRKFSYPNKAAQKRLMKYAS